MYPLCTNLDIYPLFTNFFYFRLKIHFLGKFGPKYQNCQLKLKFSTQSNLNTQKSMVLFTFSVFKQKYAFWANLVQKIKILSLSLNLVTGVI